MSPPWKISIIRPFWSQFTPNLINLILNPVGIDVCFRPSCKLEWVYKLILSSWHSHGINHWWPSSPFPSLFTALYYHLDHCLCSSYKCINYNAVFTACFHMSFFQLTMVIKYELFKNQQLFHITLYFFIGKASNQIIEWYDMSYPPLFFYSSFCNIQYSLLPLSMWFSDLWYVCILTP